MRYSVIIPVYNVADYLCRSIDSVLANDTSDAEIIIVDDGSTDGISASICDEYGKRYPELIRVIHQENRGLGGARNTAIDVARGDYLFFLDSDDTIAPDTLSVIGGVIDHHRPDIAAFGFAGDDGEGTLSPVPVSAPIFDKPFTLPEHPQYLLSLPSVWQRAWRRALFTENGIRFPERVWYEDIRTTVKLFAAAESIVVTDRCLYRYLQRSGSIMNSSALDRNLEITWAFDDIISWYREHGLYEKYKDTLTRLAIDHVFLAATVRVARASPKSPLLAQLYGYMERTFPDFAENPLLSELSFLHKLLFFLIKNKRYGAVNFLFRLKG